MKTAFIALLALALIGGGYYWYTQQDSVDEAPEMISDESTGESVVETGEAPEVKINIDLVCEGALAYMSFPDEDSADQFVAECKEGEHPEVIERYKAEMNPSTEAEI